MKVIESGREDSIKSSDGVSGEDSEKVILKEG